MKPSNYVTEAVLRIGEVTEVSGRRIYVRVDKDKNLSHLFFDGSLLRNVSVNSYVEIRKGFMTLIGKVEGEKVDEESTGSKLLVLDKNRRTLTVALVGFVDKNGKFFGGTRELPLIGNETFLVSSGRIHQIHQLASEGDISVSFAKTEYEDYPIAFPVDGLFNSHIAIFGNTGSGKSNTLAAIYKAFIEKLRLRNLRRFDERCRFLFFDFNGEYTQPECLTDRKVVFNLSTRGEGDKLPISQDDLLDIELLAILADATEKTQRPFLRRVLRLFEHVWGDGSGDHTEHFKNILRQRIYSILQMSDKVRVDLLFDYLREILPQNDEEGNPVELASDIEWHNQSQEYKIRGTQNFLKSQPAHIEDTVVYRHVDQFQFSENLLTNLILFMYLQLISDVISNRAQNEHIAPAINKLKSKREDIEKVFDTSGEGNMWSRNVVVINLHNVNTEMKKTIPLMVAKKQYADQKRRDENCSLSIIIDEAHNILSSESIREAESWRDYRLEVFEEIIKEGRKFGVFVTIASQRPNDISPTITSQAHNYFIHRLINQRDLATIASAVSYIDQLSEESIPSLPTGTCIFSGTAGQMPLKLVVALLDERHRPKSGTLEFSKTVPRSPFARHIGRRGQ